MPSVKLSKLWFARVDYPLSEVSSKLNEVTGWVDLVKVFAMFHQGEKKDNPHFYAVIQLSSEIQKQSFDVRLKKIFEVKGSQYSSKACDGADEAFSYMFHEEGAPILVNRGYTEDDIARFTALNKSIQKVVAMNKKKASCRIPERVIEAIRESGKSSWTIREIFDWVINQIRIGEIYHPGDFRLKSLIQESYIRTADSPQFAKYSESAFQNLFPGY